MVRRVLEGKPDHAYRARNNDNNDKQQRSRNVAVENVATSAGNTCATTPNTPPLLSPTILRKKNKQQNTGEGRRHRNKPRWRRTKRAPGAVARSTNSLETLDVLSHLLRQPHLHRGVRRPVAGGQHLDVGRTQQITAPRKQAGDACGGCAWAPSTPPPRLLATSTRRAATTVRGANLGRSRAKEREVDIFLCACESGSFRASHASIYLGVPCRSRGLHRQAAASPSPHDPITAPPSEPMSSDMTTSITSRATG